MAVELWVYFCKTPLVFNLCLYVQACFELSMEGLSHILPEDYIIVVFKYGMAQELLWRVSWALNVIGHNVVDLSDFDWQIFGTRLCNCSNISLFGWY